MMRSWVCEELLSSYPGTIVYHLTASDELIEARLKERAEPLGTRFELLREEITLGQKYAYRTFDTSQVNVRELILKAISEDF
jgi:hypothetical protein